MTTQLPIVTYGNGDLLREMFNAIAASMGGSSSFSTLVHLTLGFAGVWAIVEFITKRNLALGVRWFAIYFIAFYVVFLPKATVNIIDRVNQGKVYAVDNVPLGLAILASYSTVIGDSLTQLMEQNFSLPDDLRYSRTGMVMASNLVTAASTFEITDATFANAMEDFIHQCVFYDVLLNKYTAEDLVSTGNIWALVTQHASPARAFMYNRKVTTCKDGAQALTRDWQTAIDQSADRYGRRLFSDNAQAKTQLLQYLPVSYGFLTHLSENASSLIQQNMMANALQNGILGWSARSNAPAALASYAFNKAQQQNRMGNRTLGDMAAYWLPLLKNVLEGMLYGAFVLVFLLLLFPFGCGVLKHYVFALVWLQLWPPLYAVINLYMSYYAQQHTLAAISISGEVRALSLSTQSGLAQVNMDMAGLAGYLSLSVPALAWMLLKGVFGMLQLSHYVGGMLQSGATSSATETASGSLSLGNTHFSTHSAYNTSANHFDTSAKTFSGMVTQQMPGGSSLSMTPDGSTVMNNQSAISSLGTSINLASAIRSTALQQADIAYSSALSHQQSSSEAVTEAEREALELSYHQGTSTADGQSFVVSNNSRASQALNNLVQFSQRHTDSRSNSENNSNTTQGSVGIQGNIGIGLPSISPVRASVGISGGGSKIWSNTESEQASHSQGEEIARNTSYAENIDIVFQAVKEGSFRATTEEGQRMLENISTSVDRAHQEQVIASNQFQQAQSYREVASMAQENALSINSNANQEFMQSLQRSGKHMREI